LLVALGSVLAAPAIVPYASLTPVRGVFVTVDGKVLPVWAVDADLLIGRDRVGRVLEKAGRIIKPTSSIAEARRILRLYPWLLRRPPVWMREDVRNKAVNAFLSAPFS
jgi:hypothetical protein